jgi:outer membrane autotransporter protein
MTGPGGMPALGDVCASSYDGAVFLTSCVVTLNCNTGWGMGGEDVFLRGSTLSAKDTKLTVTGNGNEIVYAYWGGVTTLDHSTVNGSGTNNLGLVAYSGKTVNPLPSTINVLNNSTVTSAGSGSSAAFVGTGSILNVVDSTIHGDFNGIEITDDSNTLGPNTVSLTSSKLTNLAGGNGEAAFKVEGAVANIAVTNSTVDSGVGATQHTLLDVTQTEQVAGKAPSAVNATTAVTPTPQVGTLPSLVDLTASNSTLNGDILVDASSSANVKLEHNTVLNGATNQNSLTGATGIIPNPGPPQVNPLISGPLPFTVNLGIDSTSIWNMRASSTLDTLAVNPQAHINFPDPPASFKTLVMNNLVGTGGIFGMHVDLGLIQGDLIQILKTSEGEHLLTFVNLTQKSDLPVNKALLVVTTADFGAGFNGEADGGTFRYFVVHGDGSSVTPVKSNWYLVRGDEITSGETTPPNNPNPTPTPPPTGGPTPPEFTPGDDLPLPTFPSLPPIAFLTPAANAAIGTFAATMPLFYADMDTLIERMGELRLQTQAAPAPTTPIPSGVSKEGGKEVVAPPAPVAPPPGGGIWFRGFGSGSHIDDQVSRSFHQNLGGFQIGADKRLVTRYGDLYLGGFAGYFYAHRDFQNQPFNNDSTGTTQAFSLGAYGTLIIRLVLRRSNN